MSAPVPDPPQRWVLHLDMDSFFASVEQLTRPTLRGRPVLVGGRGRRGVVAGASYEARAFGARSAQPMHQALALVGYRAVVVPGRHAVYSAASRRVFALVREQAGLVEQLGIDEAFLEPPELAGAPAAAVEAWADDLRARIREATGLVGSVGAGSGKQVAKIASDLAKPDGVCVIPRSAEAARIGALPVRALWGIGPVADEKLRRVGIHTVADLAAMHDAEVTGILGRTIGPALVRLARGEDDRPLVPHMRAKQVSAEHTYAEDLLGRDALETAIARAATAALRRLDRDGRAARTITLKLRRADMSLLTRSYTLAVGTTDPELVGATARRLLPDPVGLGPIRLVGVGLSGLTGDRQQDLFPSLAPGVPTGARDAGVDDVLDDVLGDGVWSGEPAEGDADAGASGMGEGGGSGDPSWWAGQDVAHPEYGHGWVQGAGHGRVSVRFETRATGPGRMRDFVASDPDLRPADPLESLAWDDAAPGEGEA